MGWCWWWWLVGYEREGGRLTGRGDCREYRQRLKDAKLELKKSQRKNYYKILEVAKVRRPCTPQSTYVPGAGTIVCLAPVFLVRDGAGRRFTEGLVRA
jgi:hypothetical protein